MSKATSRIYILISLIVVVISVGAYVLVGKNLNIKDDKSLTEEDRISQGKQSLYSKTPLI